MSQLPGGSLSGARVAVTGGTGFLGVHAVEALTKAGAEVAVLVRSESPRARIESFRPFWVEGDLTSSDALATLAAGASVFVHVAGLTNASRQERYDEVNVEGTRRAVRAAAAAGVNTFVLVSSQAAAGPAFPGTVQRRRESDAESPRSGYGRSKRGAEMVLEEEGTGIASRVILRPGAIYGPYDRAFLAYFRLVSMGLRPVLGRGRRTFQPVWAGDVAEACVAAARAEVAGTRAYFIVGPETVTWESFGKVLSGAMNRSPLCVRIPEVLIQPRLLSLFGPTRAIADRLADVLEERWEAEGELAARELGWSGRMPLEEGLRKTWSWYCDHGWVSPR